MDLADLSVYAVHIHSVEQANQVFEYYARPENGGYTHTSVGEGNCLEYPYLMPSRYSERDIMGATRTTGYDRKAVEFDDWFDYINRDMAAQSPTSAEDIASFIGISGVCP